MALVRSRCVARALNEPDVKQRLRDLQYEIVASKPDEFARYVAKDLTVMRDLARKIEATAAKGRKAP